MPIKNTLFIGWARFIYGFVALNALTGAFILIFLSEHTDTLFFWPIKPTINARLFGVLYLGGAVAVWLAVWRNRWEPARYLVPVLVMAGMLISWVTVLHLDNFTPGIRLWYWLLVYVGAPLLAIAIYIAQERKGATWAVTVPVKPVTRRVAVVTGWTVLVAGIALILWPVMAVANWPWPTSPLMLRIFAAWFGAFGAGLLWFNVEQDWQRLRHLPNLMVAAAGLDLLCGVYSPAGHYNINHYLLAVLRSSAFVCIGGCTVAPVASPAHWAIRLNLNPTLTQPLSLTFGRLRVLASLINYLYSTEVKYKR